MWKIRPAAPQDVPAIISLIHELADYEKLTDMCVITENHLRKHLFGTSDDRAAEALVAQLDSHIVGYALFFKNFSTFLGVPGIYLEDVYVQPAHRGKGIGKAFLKSIAQLAASRGYGRVEWTVLNWNTPSIEFYKKIGAEPLNEWMLMRLTGEKLRAFAQ